MRFLAFCIFLLCSVPAFAQTPTTVWDARTYGVTCNGSTDIGAALNSLISEVSAIGGGVIQLPAGTCETSVTIVINSNVTLRGEGRYVTFIQAMSTMNVDTDLFQSYNFASLTGTGSNDAPYKWVLEDLTLDGNAGPGGPRTGSGTGRVLAVYSWGYHINNVRIIDGPGTCAYSEAGNEQGGISGDSLDPSSYWYNVFVYYCGEQGVVYTGPSDSYFDNVQVTQANGAPSASYGNGIVFTQLSSGSTSVNTEITNLHVYQNNNYGIVIDAPVDMTNVESETNNGQGASPSVGGGGIIILGNSGYGSVGGAHIWAWGNSGAGLLIDNQSSNNDYFTSMSDVHMYDNSGDGIQVYAANSGVSNVRIQLSNVFVSDNSGDGINACAQTTGSQLYVEGLVAVRNGGDGIYNCLQESQFTDVNLNYNSGYGYAWDGTTNSMITLTGQSTDNSSGDISFGTLGTLDSINMMVDTVSETCQTGTVPSSQDNNVSITCAGGGTNSSINYVAVAPTAK